MQKRSSLVVFGLLFLCLISCSEIKTLTLPTYSPPDLSSVKRPDLPVPQEGKDYFIDYEKNTVTYTISGQDLLTAKVISEKSAWAAVEMLKQMVDIQTQIIIQDRQLIVQIDLARQYAERDKTYADIKMYASWVIEIFLLALIIAK